MSSASLAGSIVLLLAAIALPLVVVVCAVGRIGVNHLVGIRVRYVMASAETWQAGHRAAVIPVCVGAFIAIVLDLVGLSLPAQTSGMSTALATVILVLGLSIGGFLANRVALDTLGREYEDDKNNEEQSGQG